MPKTTSTLAKRLINARAAVSYSQEEVAQAIGITQPSYSALERGVSQSTSKIGSLAKLFGVDAYWLETGIGEMHSGSVSESNYDYLPRDKRRLMELIDGLNSKQRKALLELMSR